jgi:hypothetical protein
MGIAGLDDIDHDLTFTALRNRPQSLSENTLIFATSTPSLSISRA